MKNKIRKIGSWAQYRMTRKQHDKEIVYVNIAVAITVFVAVYILQY